MERDIPAVIDEFFSKYPVRKYGKGEIIIHPGDELTHIFYLTEGLVAEYDISQSGNEVVVNTFKPGAFFPMSLAINPAPNPYYFEVTKPSVIHKAPAADAVSFLKDNPDVSFDLLRRVYRGTDGLLRRMAHLMGGKAKSRLIFELLNAAHRFGSSGRSGSVTIPLTESDLAKRSGLSRETVSRIINALKEQQLLETKSGSVIIYDLNQLEAILGSDL